MAAGLQTLLRRAEETMQHEGVLEDDRGHLLQPLYQLSAEPQMQTGSQFGVALYRSPKILAGFSLSHNLGQGMELMERFQLAPLVEEARCRTPFLLLALSRAKAMLYEAGPVGMWPADAGAGLPGTFAEFHQLELSERQDLNRSHGSSPHGGAGAGSSFGTGTEQEREFQRLRDYYSAVDGYIRRAMPEMPLVLCGAVAETSLFRQVSSHNLLLESEVSMSPDGGAPPAELERQARQLMHAFRGKQELRAVERYRQSAPEKTTTAINEILQAAADGRVEHLFFQTRERLRGNTRRIFAAGNAGPRILPGSYVCFQEDLVNAAVVETLRHRGSVWPVPPELVPDAAPAAALLRFTH